MRRFFFTLVFSVLSAVVFAERIARRGAHNDGFYFFDAYTNRLAHDGLDLGKPVWVHTDGTVTVRSPAPGLPIQELAQTAAYSNITVYAPLQSSYGFLPAGKWPDFLPSLIWTATTDKGSRIVTWEGARLERDVSRPVSFQAEFHENGEVTYRYDTFPTNGVATGVFRNGAALAFNPADPQSFRLRTPIPISTSHSSTWTPRPTLSCPRPSPSVDNAMKQIQELVHKQIQVYILH